jgi:hypothetical protein
MKKGAIIGIVFGVALLGVVIFYFSNSEKLINTEEKNITAEDKNTTIENKNITSEENESGKEINQQLNSGLFCPNYDDNQEQCLLHEECKWIAEENICNSIFGDQPNPELEAIQIPDNPSNSLCKKLPLSRDDYGLRYSCLAVVNYDARFCKTMDEGNDMNICLAHANKDSSYCEKVEGQDPKHNCYYKLAVSSENADFCSDIDYDQNEKEQCYFNFMSNLYQWGRSDEIKTEYCNQLSSPDDATCLALKAKDVSMCGSNPNCLTFFEQPLSFCDSRPDYTACIKDRAKISQNVSICEMLPQPDRDSCVGVYCTHIGWDVNVCDKIEDIKKKEEVYAELAMFLNILREN